jgi:hypothetical protein
VGIKADKSYGNGDTYERYCQRSRIGGIEPQSFRDWLAWELAMTNRWGPHVKLDDHQRQLVNA